MVNAGTIRVGGSGSLGTLAILSDISQGILGNYTQSSTGKLYLEVSGHYDSDLLSVDGLATLGGLLDVDSLDALFAVGDNYLLMTYAARSGQFVSPDLPPPPSGVRLELIYQDLISPYSLKLWAVEA